MIAVGGVSGVVSGVVVLGIGGRLAMRLSGFVAAVDDPIANLLTTGDGFRVGRITLDGSLGFVLFGGVFGGIVAAMIWVLAKQWLPVRNRWVWAGVIAAAVGGNQFVKPENIDFVILTPVVVNVILYPLLAGVAGITIAVVDSWLGKFRFKNKVLETALAYIIALSGLQLGALLLAFTVAENPWTAIGVIPLFGIGLVGWYLDGRSRRRPRWVGVAGIAATFVFGAVAWLQLGASAVQILG